MLPNKAPLVSNEDMVLNAIKTCISELRMASHRSHLPILNYSAAVQRSAYCMADMAEEQEGEAGHERCLGTRVLRSILADCMLQARRAMLYNSFSPNSTERRVLETLQRDGYVHVRARNLKECHTASAQVEYKDSYAMSNRELVQVAHLLWQLHGQLQPIQVLRQELQGQGQNDDEHFQEGHFDSIYPMFKAWYYTHNICQAQGAIMVQPGSHRLTAGKLWWIHEAGSKLGEWDFGRRMIRHKAQISTRASELSPPGVYQHVCGLAGSVVIVDVRSIHARGIIEDRHRITWMFRPKGDPRSRGFKVFR